MKRKISIRWSLIRSFIFVTFMLSALLLIATIVLGERTAERAALSYLKQTGSQTNGAVREFLGPVNLAFQTATDSFRSDLVNHDTPEQMDKLFSGLMKGVPQISSINTGDENGNGYMILKTKEGWQSRQASPVTLEAGMARWREIDRNGVVREVRMESSKYDPREQPWYKEARRAKEGKPHTTEPYRFKTTGEIGVTISQMIQPKNGPALVIAFDILSRDISKFSASVRPSENGKLLVFLDDGRVTGLPADIDITDQKKRDALLLEPVENLGLPEVTAAIAKWKELGRGDNSSFKISVDGDKWWCYLHKLPLRQTQPSWFLSMVPQKDLMGNVNFMMLLILVITVIVLLFAIAVSMLISQNLSRPIHELVQQSAALRRLETDNAAHTKSRISEIIELSDVNERMRVALDAFARYIPTDVVKQLIDKGEAAKLGGRTEELTILFTDIADFTRISESMPPTDLILHLAPYFEEVLNELQAGRATVDKFIGDAIVAFWGAPTPDPDHQGRAIATIWRCHQAINRLNEKWEKEGRPPLVTRFGVTHGEAVVGNVGAPGRLNYTVLGDRVNLASRLEGTNKKYGTSIMVADPIPEATRDSFVYRKVDVVAVKGKTEGTAIYELMGPIDEVSKEQMIFKRVYEEAFELYENRRFGEAILKLHSLDEIYLAHLSVVRLIDQCKGYQANQPKSDWNGVTPLNSK